MSENLGRALTQKLQQSGSSLLEVRSVVFDLDGTLVDSMPFYCEAWQTAFREKGVQIPPETIYAHEGEKAEDSVKNFYRSVVGSEIDVEEGQRILARYKEVFREIYETRFYPGARELIEEVGCSGAKLGLVTGTSELERRFGGDPHFLNCFDAVVTGADTTKGKPAPDPFLICLKKLGLAADSVLVVENAPFGIRSAVAAGLACVAVVGSSPLSPWALTQVGAAQVFPTILDFRNQLFEF